MKYSFVDAKCSFHHVISNNKHQSHYACSLEGLLKISIENLISSREKQKG